MYYGSSLGLLSINFLTSENIIHTNTKCFCTTLNVGQRISTQTSAHLLIFGREVPCAVGDLCASIFYDLSADWDVGHPVHPAVGVGWLEERKDTGGWGRGSGESIRAMKIIHFPDCHRNSDELIVSFSLIGKV